MDRIKAKGKRRKVGRRERQKLRRSEEQKIRLRNRQKVGGREGMRVGSGGKRCTDRRREGERVGGWETSEKLEDQKFRRAEDQI